MLHNKVFIQKNLVGVHLIDVLLDTLKVLGVRISERLEISELALVIEWLIGKGSSDWLVPGISAEDGLPNIHILFDWRCLLIFSSNSGGVSQSCLSSVLLSSS